MENPFFSLLVLRFYLNTWIPTMVADFRPHLTLAIAAGLQQGPIGKLKRLPGTMRRNMSVVTLIQRLTVALKGEEAGLLVLDALRFQQCNTVSANSQALQQLTLHPEKSLDWMRQDSEH